MAFNVHDAFLGTAIAQKIDAAIPDNFLIHDCEFYYRVFGILFSNIKKLRHYLLKIEMVERLPAGAGR